jgi:subtilase family serine protease
MADVPEGFGAGDLQAAYNLPIARGAGQTIAIVDAQDDPTAEANLAAYRTQYGLPPCTTANGCFKKVNQRGDATPLPDADGGWAVEISLDIDMVSAACPKCNILLVEGDSASVDDLGAAVDTAVSLGANVVSNSYGLDEFNGMQDYYIHYQHSGHVIVASSGDYGFTAAQFPAVTPGVLAVGGTSLYAADNDRGWTEHAWSGAGSGCSAYVDKPSYQKDKHCGMRTIADVSAVADPDTGVAIYDTTPNPYGIPPGWLVIGGTSASSPFVAGTIGLAGNAATFTPGFVYKHASATFDVVGGSNGFCGNDYLCTGKKGYDGPTGVGTPNGTGAL